MDFDQIIFKNVSYSTILEKIYNNTKKKDKSITSLIDSLKEQITSTNTALQMVPLVKEYLNAGLKNDENLIKMLAIVQRSLINNGDSNDGWELGEDEKEELLKLSKSHTEAKIKEGSKEKNKLI